MRMGFSVEVNCSRCGRHGEGWVSASLLRGESKERLVAATIEKVELTPPPYWVPIEGLDGMLCENCK